MISQIYIKNFRSIKEITLEPTNLTALIGPNGSGKTNILTAINLVLGEGWTTKAKVARELFNDSDKPIVIEISFRSPITVPSNVGYPDTEVSSIKLSMSLNPELNAKTTINGDNTFWGHEKFKKLCHFILIPSERQLSSELKVSQWTMLGKLMKLIYENYIKNKGGEDKLKEEFKQKISEAKNFLENDFDQNEVTFKKFSDCFKKHCQENNAGLASNFNPVLNIYNLNWFYKTLQINVEEEIPNKYFDSEEVGAGMQNLLLISIFQTYAELMGGKVIFGLEEPEIYLYPHAQRSLYENLIKLSGNTQIFYTTHNPNFLNASRPDDIQIMRKDQSKGTYKLEKDNSFNNQNTPKTEIYTHFNQERNEIFFANKILLVEGDSDKICFATLCKNKWGLNLDQNGYSIIACGGKSGVNYFVGVCKIIGQNNFLAVWDQDDKTYKPENIDYLAQIKSTESGLEIPGNLEKFLGLPISDTADKVKNAYEWSLNIAVDKIPDELLKIKSFFEDKTEENLNTVFNSEVDSNPENTVDNNDDIPF